MNSKLNNSYYNGHSLERQNNDDSFLQKIGKSLIYNQDYVQSINRIVNDKYEYGEILRQQMREKDEQQAIQKIQNQGDRKYYKPNNYNPHTLSQLEKIRIQQQSSDIFNTGSLVTYQNAHPNNQQYSFQSQQQIQSPIVKHQDIQRQREEQRKLPQIQNQTRTCKGSLQKEYYSESYYEEKDRKQKEFAQSLADQINEKKQSQKHQEKPQPSQNQPETELLQKNKQNILDQLMKSNLKTSNDDQSSFQKQPDPINSYNQNHLLNHELYKPYNGFRLQSLGSWARVKTDFDILKGLYRKQEEINENQNQDLKVLVEEAQKQRDRQYVKMISMRDNTHYNGQARSLNMNNSYLDSPIKRGENKCINPQSYFYDKSGIRKSHNRRQKYDDAYFKLSQELPSQSTLLNLNYIENKFEKLKEKNVNLRDESSIQFQDEDPNLEKMLDNFYKEEVGDQQNLNSQQGKRRNSMHAKVDLNKASQKSVQNLNQSQFTEYSIFQKSEEEENQNEQSQIQTQKTLTEIQNDPKQIGEQINEGKSVKNNQENEQNDEISEMGKMNKQPNDISNLDVSRIESQDNQEKKNKSSHKNQSQSQVNEKDKKNLNDYQNKNEDKNLLVKLKERPKSAFNKRIEVNLQKIKDKSEIFSLRKVKERQIYEKQQKEKDMLIDQEKLNKFDQKDNDGEQFEIKQQDKDKQLDQILYDIGTLMEHIHTDEDIIETRQNLTRQNQREQMQYDKYQQMPRLYTDNNYYYQQDNPYLDNFYNQQQSDKYQQISRLHTCNSYNQGEQDNYYNNNFYKQQQSDQYQQIQRLHRDNTYYQYQQDNNDYVNKFHKYQQYPQENKQFVVKNTYQNKQVQWQY